MSVVNNILTWKSVLQIQYLKYLELFIKISYYLNPLDNQEAILIFVLLFSFAFGIKLKNNSLLMIYQNILKTVSDKT